MKNMETIAITYGDCIINAVIIEVRNVVKNDWYDEHDGSRSIYTVESMLCYAQNRLFNLMRETCKYADHTTTCSDYVDVLVEYCVIPEYDELLRK